MLHNGKNDLIAGAYARHRPAVRDQIHPFRRACGVDDFFFTAGVEKRFDFAANLLVLVGRQIGQIMKTSMHVCVLFLVGPRYGLDDATRLLRRCRIVQVNKPTTVHLPAKNRKIIPYLGHIVHRGSQTVPKAA